jgi:hypothetical protein
MGASGYGDLPYGVGPYGGGSGSVLAYDISYYVNLITSEYQSRSPNFIAWVTALLQKLTDLSDVAQLIPDAYDLDDAIGAQLDVLGLLVGVSRLLPFTPTGGLSGLLDDDDYRTLLRARIAFNSWNGQVDALQPIWQSIFAGGTIVIEDAQNETVSLLITGVFSALTSQMITNGLIVPRPYAVLYNFVFATLPVLGFDANTSFIAGLDLGHFA